LQLKLAASLRSAIALRACRGGRASFAQDQTKVTKADKHRPLVWILLPAGHRARDFTKLYLRDTGAETPAPNLPALAAHRSTAKADNGMNHRSNLTSYRRPIWSISGWPSGGRHAERPQRPLLAHALPAKPCVRRALLKDSRAAPVSHMSGNAQDRSFGMDGQVPVLQAGLSRTDDGRGSCRGISTRLLTEDKCHVPLRPALPGSSCF